MAEGDLCYLTSPQTLSVSGDHCALFIHLAHGEIIRLDVGKYVYHQQCQESNIQGYLKAKLVRLSPRRLLTMQHLPLSRDHSRYLQRSTHQHEDSGSMPSI